jgi:LETM1 and EF-hand domain-containing protein 1
LDHVIELAQDHGLGILLEEEVAKDILDKGVGIRHEKADLKAKK